MANDAIADIYGTLTESEMDPLKEMQLKRFDFPQGFGPEGWRYYDCILVLQRRILSPGKHGVFFTFSHRFESYGRWSGDKDAGQAWTYRIALLKGTTPLLEFDLGKSYIECIPNRATLNGDMPFPIEHQDDIPFQYFDWISQVRLSGAGHIESC